jgi:hypothetical protein
MHVTGLQWQIAGERISNLAMLAAMFTTFFFVRRRAGEAAARWTVAILALMPLSLFTASAYAEALYLLASAMVLYAYDRERRWTAGFGIVATATKQEGALLALALIVDGIRRRRAGVVAAGFVSIFGFAAFAFYCWHRFGNPFVFATAEHAWRGSFGFDWAAWSSILQGGFAGWKALAQAAALVAIAVVVLRSPRLDAFSTVCGCVAIALEVWCWGREVTTVLLVGCGGIAVFAYRRQIGAMAALYAAFSLTLFLLGGTPFSVDRYAYTVIPVDFALALIARRYPALGYPALVAMSAGLAHDAALYAQNLWVA